VVQVRRAAGAGYGAIVVTVDSVVLGSREADSRNGFRGLPSDLSLVNYQPYARDHVSHFDDRVESAWDQNTEKLFDRRLSWADVTWLKSLTTLPLIVKGVLRADDAIAAIDAGKATCSTFSFLPTCTFATAHCTFDAPYPVCARCAHGAAQVLTGSSSLTTGGGSWTAAPVRLMPSPPWPQPSRATAPFTASAVAR